MLWRRPELRFLAVTSTLIIAYVLAWVPGKGYYTFGIAPELLAAGSVAAERSAPLQRRRHHRLAAARQRDRGQDAALAQAGQPPTSIFTGAYGEAGALDVLGSGYRLPPVLSGHNAYWMWGPGQASDRTVLVVDALGQLRPYFASCRLLATFNPPYHVQNDWTDLQIGVCTRPVAGWNVIWPHVRYYD